MDHYTDTSARLSPESEDATVMSSDGAKTIDGQGDVVDLEAASTSETSSVPSQLKPTKEPVEARIMMMSGEMSASQARRRGSSYFLEITRSSQILTNDFEEEQDNNPPPGRVKIALCALGLICGFVMCFVELGGDRKINQTLAIAIWMASLWITEVIPLVVTAFLPLILFPLFGILSGGTVASQYVNNTIFLLIGGFLIALTLERWNLHRRFALKVLTWCGVEPRRLLFGIMGTTFVLSMFVSNTATTLMMVPNAISICVSLEESTKNSFRTESRIFGTAVMLGIAYAANVGGMSSLIGTPTNLVFQRQMDIYFPDAPQVSFATWLGFGVPTGLVMFLVIWAYLSLMYLRNFQSSAHIDPNIFRTQYDALGAWSWEQIGVCVLFVLEGFLWLFRRDLEFDSFTIKGWANIFPEPSFISDATVGMAIAFILFVTPARQSKLAEEDVNEPKDGNIGTQQNRKVTTPTTTLLDWETANKMPYDIVFLLGGGFALAKGFVESGLSTFLGDKVASFDLSVVAMVFLSVFLIIWLTELTSNTSTSNIMVPIAASIAVAFQTNPYTFMIPVTMACSCAFALPIATPPNMVVFSTGRLPLVEMNKAGIFLNIVCSAILLGAAFSIIPAVTGVGATDFPSWAQTIR